MKRIIIPAAVVCVSICLITAAVLYAGSKKPQDQSDKKNSTNDSAVHDTSEKEDRATTSSPELARQKKQIEQLRKIKQARRDREALREKHVKKINLLIDKKIAEMIQLEKSGTQAQIDKAQEEFSKLQLEIERKRYYPKYVTNSDDDTATSSSPAPITIRAAKKSARRNKIKQMYRQLENKMARLEELERAGKKDAFKEAQQEISNLKEEIAELEELQGDDPDYSSPNRGYDPPFVEPGFRGEPDMPPMGEPRHRGPRDEIQNRIEHMMQAARHLEEAGMRDRARDLREEAEEMAGEQGGNHDLRKLLHLVHELKSEMKGLRREVRELRKGGKYRTEPLDFDNGNRDGGGDFERGSPGPPQSQPIPVDGGEPDISEPPPFGRSSPGNRGTSSVPPVRGLVPINPVEGDSPFGGNVPANPKVPSVKKKAVKDLKPSKQPKRARSGF